MVSLKTGLIYLIVYSYSLYYCIKFVFVTFLLFLTKAKSGFWKVKKRPFPPQCLLDKDLGEHKIAKVNGINLHYVEKGNKSKPLMIMVHGFPEFWYSWRHQIKEFSKDYWVVAVDMRGYNESDKPKGVDNYKIDLLASDIRELLNHLGRKKFILVAHDWGSLIAFYYVQKYMDTIEAYICMDAGSSESFQKLVATNYSQFRKSWYMLFFQVPWLPEFMQRLFDFQAFGTVFKSENITKDDLEAFKYVFSKKGAQTPPINYYRANVIDMLLGKCALPKPKKFAPGLYLHGEKDFYVDIEVMDILKNMFPNLDGKVIPKATHFAQQDQPEATNKLMREFLKKL